MDPNPAPTSTPASDSAEDNTAALLSYLTLLGFIAAIIIHSNKKTALGAFHLRQTLGLWLLGVAGSFALAIVGLVLGIIPFLGDLMAMILWMAFVVGMFALCVIGFLAALNRSMQPLPVVGPLFQKWFATAFT